MQCIILQEKFTVGWQLFHISFDTSFCAAVQLLGAIDISWNDHPVFGTIPYISELQVHFPQLLFLHTQWLNNHYKFFLYSNHLNQYPAFVTHQFQNQAVHWFASFSCMFNTPRTYHTTTFCITGQLPCLFPVKQLRINFFLSFTCQRVIVIH